MCGVQAFQPEDWEHYSKKVRCTQSISLGLRRRNQAANLLSLEGDPKLSRERIGQSYSLLPSPWCSRPPRGVLLSDCSREGTTAAQSTFRPGTAWKTHCLSRVTDRFRQFRLKTEGHNSRNTFSICNQTNFLLNSCLWEVQFRASEVTDWIPLQ